MILVAGATGYLGSEICRRLIARGDAVRGLARPTSDSATVTRLRALGVEVVEGDLREAQSLGAACQGVAAVVSTATTTRSRQPGDSIEATDQQGQLNLIDAAKRAAVKHFVFISYSGQIGTDDPLTTAKRTAERRLRESGITFTILRPSVFMEVWLSPAFGFDYANARATIFGSGERKISWVSLSDVAELAVRSIDAPAARNATIELGGPEALSPNEVIRMFEAATGRQFEVERVPEEALRAQEKAATDSLTKSFAALQLAYAKGDEIPMDDTLKRYPMKLRSVREYVEGTTG